MATSNKRIIVNERIFRYRLKALNFFSGAGLTIVAIATIFAGYQEIELMFERGRVSLADELYSM